MPPIASEFLLPSAFISDNKVKSVHLFFFFFPLSLCADCYFILKMREVILYCKHNKADRPQKADKSMSALKTYVMNYELKPCFALPCKNLLRACIVKEGAPIFSYRLHDVRLTYSPNIKL